MTGPPISPAFQLIELSMPRHLARCLRVANNHGYPSAGPTRPSPSLVRTIECSLLPWLGLLTKILRIGARAQANPRLKLSAKFAGLPTPAARMRIRIQPSVRLIAAREYIPTARWSARARGARGRGAGTSLLTPREAFIDSRDASAARSRKLRATPGEFPRLRAGGPSPTSARLPIARLSSVFARFRGCPVRRGGWGVRDGAERDVCWAIVSSGLRLGLGVASDGRC